jgi:polar amino acid transport system permease protein
MFGSTLSQLTQLFSYYNVLLLLEGLVATFVLSVIGCFAGFVSGFMAR